MKYNPPFGSTNQNASYVNGTPSTKGSVIPAEAIESPQREIVNAIIALGLTPSASDNSQLAKGLLSKSSGYSNTVDYDNPTIVIGSDGLLYVWKQANGPSTTVVNPVDDTAGTYWAKYDPAPPDATSLTAGLVKLSDSLEGTENADTGETAATPYAVKKINDIIVSLEVVLAEFQRQLISESDTLTRYQVNANARMQSIESSIASTDQSVLNGRMDTLEGNFTTLDNTVTGLGTTVSGINTRLTAVENGAAVNDALEMLNKRRVDSIGTMVQYSSTTLDDEYRWPDGTVALFADYPEFAQKYQDGGFDTMLLPYDATAETIARYPGKFRLNQDGTGVYLPNVSGSVVIAWNGATLEQDAGASVSITESSVNSGAYIPFAIYMGEKTARFYNQLGTLSSGEGEMGEVEEESGESE